MSSRTKTTFKPEIEASVLPAGLANFDDLPRSAHVRLPTVSALISASSATTWRWVKLGRLPAPKKLGPGVTAWNVGELRDALADRRVSA